MGRGIEKTIMGFILDEAKKQRVTKLKGEYIPTKKNKPCEEFLPSCGFQREEEHWVYSPAVHIKVPTYIELQVEL